MKLEPWEVSLNHKKPRYVAPIGKVLVLLKVLRSGIDKIFPSLAKVDKFEGCGLWSNRHLGNDG